jgi:NitT/TauT family transport system substrate-binding protein
MRILRRRRTCQTSLIVLSLVIAVAGCGFVGSDGSGFARVEKATLNIGTVPASSAAPILIAEKRGLLKQAGLKVKLQILDGGPGAMKMLNNGQLDLLINNNVTTLQAQSEGLDLRIVQEIDKAPDGHFRLVVGAKSPIRSMQDIKGKTIGVNTRRNVAELSIRMVLQINGIDIKRDRVKFARLNYADTPKALTDGRIDATWLFDPWLTLAERQGARSVAFAMAGPLDDFPMTAYISTAAFADKNPRTVAAFKSVIVKAQSIAAQNRSETDTAMAQLVKQDRNFISTLVLSDYLTSTNPVRLQRVSDLMLRFGYIPKRLNVRPMII